MMLETTNHSTSTPTATHATNGPEWTLEQLGRISFQCLTDRQNGDHYTIEHYVHANPQVSPDLIRTMLEPTLLLYSVAKTPPSSASDVG